MMQPSSVRPATFSLATFSPDSRPDPFHSIFRPVTRPFQGPTPPVIDIDAVPVADPVALGPDDLADLRRARSLLSSPGVAIRFASLLGAPIEKGIRLLPSGATKLIHGAARLALEKALHMALHSLAADDEAAGRPANRFHKLLVGASGAVGGAFGLGAMAVELPLSTTLILRSIAQIAASQGHDLKDVRTRLACLEVFALGGETTADNAAETSYWAVRTALARLVTEAAGSVVQRGLAAESTPAAVRLITALAARFGVIVSEQVAAKAVPIVGAATGAAINVVFMDHFQKMAEGHFIARRLEHTHGSEVVRRIYESIGAVSR